MSNKDKRQRNYYLKVLAVQTVYLEHHKAGLKTKEIFERYIKDQFFMNERNFFRLLNINAKAALTRIDNNENNRDIPTKTDEV